MGEILILKSINGSKLTNKLIDSWFNANEMFITNKTFSNDQYSVEITFIDEERADLMSDLLNTCYSNCISISRPQTLIPSLDNSFEEEREPSPVHLSSAMSTSSRVSCFSQRLVQLDNNKNNNSNLSQVDRSLVKEIENSNSTSPVPSIVNSSILSGFGRGRGAVFK